jgi:predicted glycoside hydrolase/deacetylase ChbG (UPF0249 family)
MWGKYGVTQPHTIRAMREVIVNADDFGLVREIDRAVVRGHEAGLITSATLMPNGESAPEAAGLASARGLGVGLHFTLTFGEPLAPRARSLVGGDGRFGSRRSLMARAIRGGLDADDIERELDAQWSRLVELGVRPTHLDGHQHIQVIPVIDAVIARFARAKDVRVRIPWVNRRAGTGRTRLAQRVALAALCRRAARHGMPALTPGFVSVFDLSRPSLISAADYVRLIRDARPGPLELMVHPALASDRLATIHPDLYDVALVEGRLLADPATVRAFREAGIRTVGVNVSLP